jgi:hypothetical protein
LSSAGGGRPRPSIFPRRGFLETAVVVRQPWPLQAKAERTGRIPCAADRATHPGAKKGADRRRSDLSDAEARELQGFVPAFVFPTVAGDLLKNASDFRSIVAKGLLRYDVMSQDDKRARVLKRVDAAVTQFVCQRKVEYLDALAQAMAELR